MRDNALVTAVTPDAILVVPLLTDTCINCAESSCARRGSPFPVDNPRGLPVKSGSVVSVAAKKRASAAQALFSLLFPIASAAAGYAASPVVSAALGSAPSEAFKAVCVLAGLALAAAVVLAVQHASTKQTRAEISEVIKS
jgi:hypothetical protein